MTLRERLRALYAARPNVPKNAPTDAPGVQPVAVQPPEGASGIPTTLRIMNKTRPIFTSGMPVVTRRGPGVISGVPDGGGEKP